MRRARRLRPPLCILAAQAHPLGTLAEEHRLGSEFRVNTYATDNQSFPSVAADADGDFVVAWESLTQDGSYQGIFAQGFSSAGDPLAIEFQVSTYTASRQRYPAVATDADGDFVVVWQSYLQDGSYYGIFARRFSSAGDALASEFQVSTYTLSYQRDPSVAADADGDFVVAWRSNGQDGASGGVFAQRFSNAGDPLAIELQVNAYTTGDQRNPSVAADANGDFVVAWQSFGQDGSLGGIFALRFSSAGGSLASEFQVSTYTTSNQSYPSVVARADGDFVVAWASYQDGWSYGVFAQRFSSTGAPLASEFQINAYTTNLQAFPSLAADADGDFVVTWQSLSQDGSSLGVFGLRVSSTGDLLAAEFEVNTYTTGDQLQPSVAATAGGHFVVVWQSNLQDGSGGGVFAQRFGPSVTLDIDGNGAVEPLTDGLLVLRYLFGFTGSTLTSGAVGGGCVRCDAAAIEPYLAGLGLVLDIDGNGVVEPLTDGLLILRYLFGFSGSTLTSGAVGGGCTRCDAAAIETYLAGLTG